jgi:hypothetical protein
VSLREASWLSESAVWLLLLDVHCCMAPAASRLSRSSLMLSAFYSCGRVLAWITIYASNFKVLGIVLIDASLFGDIRR